MGVQKGMTDAEFGAICNYRLLVVGYDYIHYVLCIPQEHTHESLAAHLRCPIY